MSDVSRAPQFPSRAPDHAGENIRTESFSLIADLSLDGRIGHREQPVREFDQESVTEYK